MGQLYYPPEQRQKDEAIEAKARNFREWGKTLRKLSLVAFLLVMVLFFMQQHLASFICMLVQLTAVGISTWCDFKAVQVIQNHYRRDV